MTDEVIAHDELTAGEARAAAILLGRRRDWNPDVAMRYLPVVSILDERGIREGIVELGSGASGIGPYLRRRFLGIDTADFRPRNDFLCPVAGSVIETPLRTGSCAAVISVDMLEHVPAELRRSAVDEMVRITRSTLVVAVPAGERSVQHDRAMAEAFRARRGVDHQFFLEHVEEGLPSIEEIREIVQASVDATGRRAEISVRPNANLTVRTFVIRRWIRRGLLDRVAWVAMTWSARWLARCNAEPTYRQIIVVDFSPSS